MTGTLQREAWLRTEIPPVERVVPGVWSIPVPIPGSPLRYVLSYLIEHASGFVLVDPGWNAPVSWQALTEGLAACSVPLSAVTAVLVTHVHPDHHGLSDAVRGQSGAWIGMHEHEDAQLARFARPDWNDSTAHYMRWCGSPEEHIRWMTADGYGGAAAAMARADRLLAHGDLVDVPGVRLRAVWTPGHSPGHLCFHDETHDLLLTGDHVLPRITPNISASHPDSDPLADYLESLKELRKTAAKEVLPAHEYRFAGLDARLDDLRDHHIERLEEAAVIVGSAPGRHTAWQVARRVTWSRQWSQLSAVQHQAALGEVVAHLRHLQSLGTVTCATVSGVGLWQSLPRSA
ncbi:MBL fold metallo-hydrolase [Actinomadura physcomitrii]|uniref:MBL fold metallo-hydrolase n=1 Tax=Actinomadura physcomitrii TaxID=2650748 RepID=UPI00136AA33B|nr:MBL fold metallo-hydrolase [Actinomadura physcomitrii]